MVWVVSGRSEGMFCRPLLCATRTEIEAYLARHQLTPIHDPSNDTDVYARNRVRHHVLPLLKRENHHVVKVITRVSKTLDEENEALDWCINQAWHTLAPPSAQTAESALVLSVSALRELPRALKFRAVAHGFSLVSGTLRCLNRGHLEATERLLDQPGGVGLLSLPGATVRRQYQWLAIEPAGKPATTVSIAPMCIEGPGRYDLPDGRTVAFEKVRASADPSDPTCVDGNRLTFPVTIRSTGPGDRIAIGHHRHKRVARVFIDAKIPRLLRPHVPLMTCADDVVLIVGMRRAAGWAPQPRGPAYRVRVC